MNLLIYPFDKDVTALIRCNSKFLQYEKIIPIAPKSFGMWGDDVSRADGGLDTGIVIEHEFELMLEKTSHILFIHNDFINIKSDYDDKIRKALNICDKVFVTKTLAEELESENFIVSDEVIILSNQLEIPDILHTKKLYEIPVPIISVYGVGAKSDQFYTQLSISDKLKEDGYKVVNISTKEYSTLFGMYPMPDFVYDNISEKEKVMGFNHYVYNIVKHEKPDIVVLCLPHGIMQYDTFLYDTCGSLQFMLSNAARADAAVLCAYSEEYNDDYLETINKLFEYRFNTNLVGVALTPQILNADYDQEKISYITSDYDYLKKSLDGDFSEENPMIFSAYDSQSMDKFYEKLISTLSDE